ncbi:MAG: molybdopterin-dependent oxidoreductase [Bryobacteraceae bacterium]
MNILSRFALLPLLASLALCQAPPALVVQGLDGSSATLTLADLARLPQHTVTTTAHGAPVTFQGVLLADVLAKVALPLGDKFHHTVASYYLAVEAQDGYQAVFAWAELDPTFMDKAIYLVTSRDGQPLPARDGPFQLVVPGEKRAARWVRQVTALRIRKAN